MKTIRIDITETEAIVLEGEDRTYALESSIERDDENEAFNGAIDGLESLVLAHACSGVDVSAPQYVEGVKNAMDAIANVLGD